MDLASSPDLHQRILLEDNHLIIVNKKTSEIVQADKTGDDTLADYVKTYLKEKYDKPGGVFLGVIHRLDRPVSGVVAFARTTKALKRMNELVRDRKLQKTYWAVVKSPPPKDEGTLEHYLVRKESKNKSYAYDRESPGSKKAILHYRLLAKSDEYYLLEVQLITGRHHQIRVQLSAMGCPIKGDIKYGFPRTNADASIHLHARHLSFVHPVTRQQISLTADPPEDPLWDHFLKIAGSR